MGLPLGVGAGHPLAALDGRPDGARDRAVGEAGRHHLEAAGLAVAVDGELHGDGAARDAGRAGRRGCARCAARTRSRPSAASCSPPRRTPGASSMLGRRRLGRRRRRRRRRPADRAPTTPPTTPRRSPVVVLGLLGLVGIHLHLGLHLLRLDQRLGGGGLGRFVGRLPVRRRLPGGWRSRRRSGGAGGGGGGADA